MLDSNLVASKGASAVLIMVLNSEAYSLKCLALLSLSTHSTCGNGYSSIIGSFPMFYNPSNL